MKKMLLIFTAISIFTGLTLPVLANNLPNPTVTGPISVNTSPGDDSHDYVYFTPAEDLSEYGYIEEEFFIEGLANSYEITPGQDGTVLSGDHAYRTRIVVRRPKSNRDFNGVVVLEWQNVTAGYELDAHWAPSWEHFIREGYAWVGVSAQLVGVHGFPPSEENPRENNGLIAWSATRYGTLDVTDGGKVTDDSLCYDIYSQAAQAIKHPQGINPMGKLCVRMVIAAGASQSAGRLSVYHNAIHPLHDVVDGFYLLVGGNDLRTDIDVKVFQYLSETDLGRGPGRRMEDSDNFRSWEVAGTGHSSYISDVYRTPLVVRDFGSEVWPPECDLPPFSQARGQYVIDVQYDLLVKWIKYDRPPPSAPKIEFSEDDPPVILRDEHGIAKGGIRLPEIKVPTALNTGTNSGSTFCRLYGAYIPFEDEILTELYPSHGQYIRAVMNATMENLSAGYISKHAAKEIIMEAVRSDIGKNTAEPQRSHKRSHPDNTNGKKKVDNTQTIAAE